MVMDSECSYLRSGEWVKGKVVGSGSFGTVHLAMCKGTGSLFVSKSAQSGAGLRFLENEAEILESLDSPYIVRCLGKESSNGKNGEKKLSIFMEYMAGGSLSDVAEKFGGVLDEKVIRLYTREILKGLKCIHENRIVHCDLKCKNVLLGSTGNVKLADFGCASKKKKKRSKSTNDDVVSMNSWQSIGGTPLWMAPEVLRNEELDFASDIWSLGCTVIEMATGKPPWGDEVSNPMAAVLKIAFGNESPRFPTQFSEEGLDFLRKCFERDAKKRWTAEELLNNHPFVSMKKTAEKKKTSKEKSTMKEQESASHSPASIFDVGIYEGYDSDDSEYFWPYDDEFQIRSIPFLTRRIGDRKRRGEAEIKQKQRQQQQQGDFEMVSSEKWVTVRSG